MLLGGQLQNTGNHYTFRLRINVKALFKAKHQRIKIMQINLTGHHVEITESLRNYVNTKFEKLERHFDHITNVHVILNIEKLKQKAEATLHLQGGEVFANSQHTDMYAAIDGLIDKLDRQVIKHKEKLNRH